MQMPSQIKRGESILIPFKDGKSIYDSQNKPRMYMTRQAFERSFPGYLVGRESVELVEYVEVVRCKDCAEYHPWLRGNICMRLGSYYGDTKPDDFCSYGRRKDAEDE